MSQMLNAGRRHCGAAYSSMMLFKSARLIAAPLGGGLRRSWPLLGAGQQRSCRPWASRPISCAASQPQSALQPVGRRPNPTRAQKPYLVGVLMLLCMLWSTATHRLSQLGAVPALTGSTEHTTHEAAGTSCAGRVQRRPCSQSMGASESLAIALEGGGSICAPSPALNNKVSKPCMYGRQAWLAADRTHAEAAAVRYR